jgi:putative glycosyltransferase (TIGR04372 family)
VPNQLGQHHDIYGSRRSVRSHFELSVEDLARAIRAAEELGIQPNDRFVCLQVRDSAYLRWQTGKAWFDNPDRNANIEDYVSAVMSLVGMGYKVIRMGVVAERPLVGPWSGDMVIDLPFSDARTELLDVYFGSRCKFFITTASGIDAVAHAMRVPLVMTNVSDYVRDLFLTHESISILRHPIEHKTSRTIPFVEFFDQGFHLLRTQDLIRRGVVFRHNSPDEIKNVVDEMMIAMNIGFATYLGEHLETMEQREFRRCVPEWMLAGGVRGLVSSSFLDGLKNLEN